MPFIPAQAGFKLAWPVGKGERFFYEAIIAWRVDDETGDVVPVTCEGVQNYAELVMVVDPLGHFIHADFSCGDEAAALAWCAQAQKSIEAERERNAARNRGKVYVKFDSPQWRAWAKHLPHGCPELNGTGGWWFASEWPPGHEARSS